MIVSLVVVVLVTTARMLRGRMKRKACPEPAEGFHVRFCTVGGGGGPPPPPRFAGVWVRLFLKERE